MAIVNLIEMGFGEELDPQGWKMLTQMRAVARKGILGRFFSGPGSVPEGFVWEDAGTVFANLSLRPAYPRHRKGQMIGNVVVHPDYQGRGVGRALMDAALESAQTNDTHWIGLEVRLDNAAACHLYESMGFEVIGQLHHLVRPKQLPWPDVPAPQRAWHTSRPRHTEAWSRLADAVYTKKQVWVLESRPGLYEYGGFQRKLELWFDGQRERAWLQGEEAAPDLAVRVKTDLRHRFHLWDLLIRPPAGPQAVQETLSQAFRGLGRFTHCWPVVAWVADQPDLINALCDLGFQSHRTLGQMLLLL